MIPRCVVDSRRWFERPVRSVDLAAGSFNFGPDSWLGRPVLVLRGFPGRARCRQMARLRRLVAIARTGDGRALRSASSLATLDAGSERLPLTCWRVLRC